jgi:hypothetical protein
MPLGIALQVALGLTNHRWSAILGRESGWIVLVPIWTAGLYIHFQSLTCFLSAAASSTDARSPSGTPERKVPMYSTTDHQTGS